MLREHGSEAAAQALGQVSAKHPHEIVLYNYKSTTQAKCGEMGSIFQLNVAHWLRMREIGVG